MLEQDFYKKINSEYNSEIVSLPELQTLPRSEFIKNFTDAQFNLLNALIENKDNLFILLNFEDEHGQEINSKDTKIEKLNIQIHEKWKLNAIIFEYFSYSTFLSLYHSNEIQLLVNEYIAKDSSSDFKKWGCFLAMFLAIVFAVFCFFIQDKMGVYLSIVTLLLSIVWYISIKLKNSNKNKEKENFKNTFIISNYFSAQLGSYATDQLYLDEINEDI